jgi:signal transduction histidine kinase/CheY-like chemotaxis protein
MANVAFSSEEEAALGATIFCERVYVLYGNPILGQAVTLVIAFAIALLAWTKVDPLHVLIWLGAVLVIATARALLALAFRRAAPGPDTIEKWYWRFFAGVTATGLQWSVAGVLFFVPGDPAAQTVLLIIFAGLAAGAVPVLAAAKKIYFVYCLLTLLPVGAMMSIQNDLGMRVVATLDVVFILAMLTVSHRFHESLTNALRLGFENEVLARQVREDRDRTESANVDLQHEVAARRRKQEELLRAKEAAEDASRAQGRMLANTSDKLREPLHGIISLANVALSDKLPQNVHDYVAKILALARALSGTLNGILDVTEIEAGTLTIERKRIRLPDLLDDVSDIFGTLAADKGLSMSVYADPGLPSYVIGDAVRIGQIVNHFVTNALKFTERGAITVDTRMIGRAGNRATVRISVRDTGTGLTREQQDAIFQSAPATEAGDGFAGASRLGLPLCKKLASAMGGRIGVESEPGKGSRFWLELPLDTLEEIRPKPAAADDDAVDLHGLNVLVVDDDRVTQLAICALLERHGVNVMLEDDGRDALNAAFDQVTPLDAVLIDIHAPVVDGGQFARSVREKLFAAALPIFAITDESHPLAPEECDRLGIDGCLTRPVAPRELIRILYAVAHLPRISTSGNAPD